MRLADLRGGLLADALVVVAFAALAAATITSGGTMLGSAPPSTFGLALAASVVMALPLAVRRFAPKTALIAVTAGIAAHQLVQPLSLVVPLGVLAVGVHSVAVRAPGRSGVAVRAVAGAATLATVLAVAVAVDAPPGMLPPRLGLFAILFVGAWLLGEQTRRIRDQADQLQARTIELERARSRSARQAATEERVRIARELHDVVGHHVSVMVMHAAGARRVLDADPARAGEALAAIEQSGRGVIGELQRVLSVLRDDHPAVVGLDRLDDVVTSVRSAGVEVDLSLDTAVVDALPDTIALAAARIVQEALTNVLRHAGPGTRVEVSVSGVDDHLEVCVVDDGAGRTASTAELAGSGGGHGLVGLRERVALHDGTFRAQPRPEGGFGVHARLPLAPSQA